MTADGDDGAVVAGMARALRPDGRLALSAFNAYFAVKYHDEATFDADTGESHERTEVRDADGAAEGRRPVDRLLHARELRLLLGASASTSSGSAASSPAPTARPADHRVPRVPRHRPPHRRNIVHEHDVRSCDRRWYPRTRVVA